MIDTEAEAAAAVSTNRAAEFIIHQLVISRFLNKTPPNVRLTTPQYAATDTGRQSIGIT